MNLFYCQQSDATMWQELSLQFTWPNSEINSLLFKFFYTNLNFLHKSYITDIWHYSVSFHNSNLHELLYIALYFSQFSNFTPSVSIKCITLIIRMNHSLKKRVLNRLSRFYF